MSYLCIPKKIWKSFRQFAILCMLIGSYVPVRAQIYEFSTAGASGATGPTQAMVDTAYLNTPLYTHVSVENGAQIWVVPDSGLYEIKAVGAQGYGSFGGRGASVLGQFFLDAGDSLKIIVGQPGLNSTSYTTQYGGGGGSFVATINNSPLLVAGGGGGSHGTAHSFVSDASISDTANTASSGIPGFFAGTGGLNGAGGNEGGSGFGGGGFTGNGTGSGAGKSFVSGGAGGASNGVGGFGGGGGAAHPYHTNAAGGGGGYSGGGGAAYYAEGGGGGSYNAGFFPVNEIGKGYGDGAVTIRRIVMGHNNAGVVSTSYQRGICPGAYAVFATIQNFGINTLDSVEVQWSVNNISQPFINYTGPALGVTGGSTNVSVQLNLGNFNFEAGVTYQLKVWTEMPNGVADTLNDNDTAFAVMVLDTVSGLNVSGISANTADIEWNTNQGASYVITYGEKGFDPTASGISVHVGDTMPYTLEGLIPTRTYDVYIAQDCDTNGNSTYSGPETFTTLCSAPLAAGVYTVNPSLAQSATNFQSLSAVSAVLSSCGISGAVTINVAEGTYNEQVYINSIPGSSPVNKVVIQADPGNVLPVVITYNVTPPTSLTQVPKNYVLNLDSASYITIQNLTFKALGSDYSRVVDLTGIITDVVLHNNSFYGNESPEHTSQNHTLLSTGGGSGNMTENTTISGNKFFGGSYAMYLRGASSSKRENGNKILDNEVNGFYYTGIYLYYEDAVEVRGNTIVADSTAISSSGQHGIYQRYTKGFNVERNKVVIYNGSTMGHYLQYGEGTSQNPAIIANNMISVLGDDDHAYGMNFYRLTYVDVVYNSVYVKDKDSTASSVAFYANGGPAYTHVNVYNNIFSNYGTGLAVDVTGTAANMLSQMDYNNLYSQATDLANWNTTTVSSLTAWQAASLKDSNSYNIDPLFTADTNLRFNAQTLNGSAYPYPAVSIDFDGESRSNVKPDIGADERVFIVGNCAPFTGLSVDSLADTVVVISWVPGSAATSYKLEYGLSGFTKGTGTVVTASYPDTTLPLHIYSLNANTVYDCYFTEYCNNGADSIYLTEAINFKTLESCPLLSGPVSFVTDVDFVVFDVPMPVGYESIEYAFGPAGFNQGTATVITGNPTDTITGLYSGTEYDLYVRNNCRQSGGGISGWSGPFSFVTKCAEASLPYYEALDYWPPLCLDTLGGDHNWQLYSGNNGDYLMVEESTSTQAYLTTPPIIVGAPAQVRLSYSHTFADLDSLLVEYEVNGNGTWKKVIGLSGLSFYTQLNSSDPTVFKEETAYLDSSLVGDTIKVRIRSYHPPYTSLSGSNDIFIKNLYVEEMPACPQPYNFSIMEILSTEVTISMDGPATDSLSYEIGAPGFVPGSGVFGKGGNPLVISGLLPQNTYDVYVRNNCQSAANGFSEWQGPFTITSGCAAGLSGTYTVDPALPVSSTNFTTIDSVVSILNTCGVTGAVTINIAPGVYNEQIFINGNAALGKIPGSNLTHTVTFQTDPQSSQRAEISSASTGDSANYVLKLENASHIIFRDLTLKSTGVSYGRIVDLSAGGNGHITFYNDSIISGSTNISNRDDFAGFYMEIEDLLKYNHDITIRKNAISGGYYGIFMQGSEYTYSDVVADSNTINDWYHTAFHAQFMNHVVFSNNTVVSGSQKAAYGAFVSSSKQSELSYNKLDIESGSSLHGLNVAYADGAQILSNTIKAVSTASIVGLRLSYSEPDSVRPLIANNMIAVSSPTSSGTVYGLRAYDTDNADYVYNSVYVTKSNQSSSSNALAITNGYQNHFYNNNIVNASGGFVLFYNDLNGIGEMDYNNLYTNGAGFAVGTTNYNTLSAWRTALSFDSASVSVLPVFLSEFNLHVLDSTLNNIGMPLSYILEDIDGDVRSLSGSDIGADEYTPVNGDLAVSNLFLNKGSACLSSQDTLFINVENRFNDTVDLLQHPLTINYEVTGPAITIGSFIVNSGIIAPQSSRDIAIVGIDLSIPGIYAASAYIDSSTINASSYNDSVSASSIEIEQVFRLSHSVVYLENASDTAVLEAFSPFFINTAVPSGLSWSLNGNVVDSAKVLEVGPFNTPGTYLYVATFSSPCGITYVDSVRVIADACALPDTVFASMLSPVAATIKWNALPHITDFYAIYGAVGFTPLLQNATFIQQDSIQINGLTANTCYDFYVQSDCGSDTSWSTALRFCTGCFEAGTDSSITLCDTSSIIDLEAYLSANAAGGTWSMVYGGAALSGSFFNPSMVPAKDTVYNVFYTTPSINGCVADTSILAIYVDACGNGSGVDEWHHENLNLYPNPVRNILHIEMDVTGYSTAFLTISDLSGRVMFKQKYGAINGDLKEKISMEKFSQGTYVIDVLIGDKHFYQKVVKH